MARPMRRILITGAGGFVGRHALAALQASHSHGDRLLGIGRELPRHAPDGVELRAVDLLDAAALNGIVRAFAPTHVLHLAALASVAQASGSPAETWRGNIVGLLNLAEAIARGEPDATLVFASSGEVYGRSFLTGLPLTETAVPEPANAYARTKLAGEAMLGDILPAVGARLIVARPFNHIGPGQDERFVVASFASQIARIEAGLSPPVLEVGDLTAQRDFLDVADVVAAYAALIEASAELPAKSLFNVASGVARPVADLLAGLVAAARVPFEVRVSPNRLRPSEIPTASGDASALAQATGWTPRVALTEALAAILDDARQRVRTEVEIKP